MIIRALTLAFSLFSGACLSQFPAYSDQYEQRLSGAIDEMRVVVANFDTSLQRLGQTREQAFAPTQDLSDREALLLGNAKANIDRLTFLEAALDRIQNASILSQLFKAPSVADQQIAARAYEDFKPALPLTVEGFACAGLGFIGGWIVFAIILSVLRMPFRTRRQAAV